MAVNIDDLTQGIVNGTGVFDVLQKAVKAHLDQEFTSGRITGVNYSTVYLGALTAVMQTAVQYKVEEERIAIANAELALQQAESIQRTALLVEEVLLKKEQVKIAKEELLLKAKELQIADKELELRAQALLKTAEEIKLLAAKVNTEDAQTKDTVAGSAVTGVVGKQKILFDKQAEAFTNDYVHKMVKLQLDSFAVYKSANPDSEATFALRPYKDDADPTGTRFPWYNVYQADADTTTP
jgi:hypothetical protein